MKSRRLPRLFAAVAVSVVCAAVSNVASTRPARAPAGPTLAVATDRADAVYPRGVPVQFIITLHSDPPDLRDVEVEWTLSKDGVPPLTNGVVRLTDGRATVVGTLDEPGFLQCRAVLRGTNQPARTAVAGAAVGPLEIPPSLPVPADFDEFWAAQKQKLAAVPINARLTPVRSSSTNIECFDLEADSDTPRFPKPDPARAFPELKVLDSNGSPLRRPVEDWAGARRRVTEDLAWRRWLADQRADADDWMARRRDRVEWISGWWHDFVSPRDGSFLTWTPDEPGDETLSSPSDPKVILTPKLHAAWVYGFRSRHAAKLLQAAQLFRLTGAQPYADWAASQLDFYATNYTRWPEKPGRGCRLMWQSLDEAVNLVKFANTVRLLGDACGKDRRQHWLDQFFRPQAALLESTFQRIHNIACWHRAAVAHVALCFDDDGTRREPVERLWRSAVDGPFGLRQQLAQGVTSDYLWFEQSLGYNSYVVGALRPLFEAAALAGRADELQTEMAIVENLMLAPIGLRFPTGQLPNPADSTGGPGRAPNLAVLAAAYRLFPTDPGLLEAARQRNWDTLLDPPSVPERSRPLPPPATRNLESSRMAILHQGDWQVFFHYGQVDASHAQAEALNYELFCGDSDITHDPGTVGYGSPLHREYFTQGLAHNVPLVNGQGQAPWRPGELLRFDEAACRVAARQAPYRHDCTAERELRIEDGRFVDVVRLTLEPGSAPAALGLALHLQGQVRLPEGFAPDSTFAGTNRPAGFRHWTDCQTATFTNTAVFEATFGARRLDLTLCAPGRFTVTHARTPDVPPARRESLYLEMTGTGAEFTTVFAPAPASRAARGQTTACPP